MGRRLYVGNLSYDVSSSDLEQLLSAHGTVETAEVISDRMTGQSKGFGFVERGAYVTMLYKSGSQCLDRPPTFRAGTLATFTCDPERET